MQDGLTKMLSAVIEGQGEDGAWRLQNYWPPIGPSAEVLTTEALLALTAPNAPDLGEPGKAARLKGLKWLEAAKPGDDPQAAGLRLRLWKRLGRKPGDWEPLVSQLRKPDFASVRDTGALAKLPEDERTAWQQYWDDIRHALKEAAAPPAR